MPTNENARQIERYLAEANEWKRLNPDNHNGFPSFAQWLETQKGRR